MPGGKTVQHYREQLPGQARCSETGQLLHGIPRMSAAEAKRAPKTSKRPQRPYGGALSSSATRAKLKERARAIPQEVMAGKLYEVGRLCMKIAGRDANTTCVIVDIKDGKALVDGESRRRLVSLRHLEPLGQKITIKAGAPHADVAAAFKKLNMELPERKPKKAAARPRQTRTVKKPKKVAKATKASDETETKAPKETESSEAPAKKSVKKAPVKKAKKTSPKN